MSNQTFTVKVGTDSPIDVGNYPAEFIEFAGPLESDKSDSQYYTFTFKDADRTYIGFADLPKIGYPKVGKNSNRLGRFMAGLAGKPPTEEFTINPADYIGKRYLLRYDHNKNGNVTLMSFTPLA